MVLVNFIEFNSDKTVAQSVRRSPITKINTDSGVQLLPNNEYPYIQSTNVNGGIELEDWTAYIVKCSDKPITTVGNQNLLTYSENAENAAWSKNLTVVTADAIPQTGTDFNADHISCLSSNGNHAISQGITKDASQLTYTGSVVVSAAEFSRAFMFLSNNAQTVGTLVHFNMNDQTFSSALEAGYSATTYGYTDEGNGFYRIWITATTDSNTELSFTVGAINNTNERNFTGDNVSGIYVRGMQLKQGALSSYLETTDSPITIESSTVIGTDITDNFLVERVFTDDKGQAQFDWSITNVPIDCGYEMVYLKVEQSIGETFYSNLFQLTAYDSDKTCRIDYQNGDAMNAIQIKLFFWQQLKNVEIGVYYEYSTGNTVNTTIKSQRHERWTTEFVPNDLMIKVSDVFENKPVYIDLRRCYLFEAIEIKEFEAEEDFKQNDIKFSFNDSDIYNPLTVEAPPQLNAEIILNSIVTNNISAIYDFSYTNFTPQSLFFQYSDDEINWTTTEKGITTPQFINFTEIGTWYFRITHPEAVSNTISIDLSSDLVANDDNVQVENSGSLSIDVLANDILVGDVEILSITQPTNGAAGVDAITNKINYTHDGSATVFDSFTYTITNSISTDTGTVNITVAPVDSTSFSLSSSGVSPSLACPLSLNQTKYHNGSLVTPSIYDFVFNDASLSTIFNGQGLYYAIQGGKYIQIDSDGLVVSLGNCGDESGGDEL